MTHQASTDAHSGWRTLAAMVVALLTLALLPSTGLAQPEPVEDPHDACPDDVNPPAPFLDRLQVPEVHRLNVDCAFNNDIARGYTDQTFRPARIVQRDQFASFMVRTLRAADVDLPQPSDQGFTDISGNTHEDAINIIAATGITVGTTPTTYSPSLRLRRDQIASFILRAAAFIEDVPLENLQRETGPFTDVPPSNVHARNINGARALNLTIGRTAGTYEPATPTRRDQMASFLIRLLAALRDGPIIPPEDRAETLDLIPETATNPVDTQHTVTATARDGNGAALADANIQFEVYRDTTGDGVFSGPVAEGSDLSNAGGESGFSYRGPAEEAQDVIVACAVHADEECDVVDEDNATAGTQTSVDPDAGTRLFDTAAKFWVVPPPVDTFEIPSEDVDATNPLREPHTVNVTAFAGGDPVDGAVVRFEVYRAPEATGTFTGPVESSTEIAGSDGAVSFTYSHDAEAVDRIVICVPDGGTCQVTDTDAGTAGTQFTGQPDVGADPNRVVTKRWVTDLPPTIVIDEADLDATNPLGESHTVTATVTDDGDPVAGAEVRFEVYRAPNATGTYTGPVESSTETSGADGRASFTYSHDARADDRIVVCAPEAGTCQVTDEDAGTAGIQFTGEPEVGAEPNAVATKRWRELAFPATSLTASAFGLNVDPLGTTLVERLPSVAIELPPPDADEQTASVVNVPENRLVNAAFLEVAARGDLARGFAQGEAEATGLEVLFDEQGVNPSITADAVHVFSTSTCPDPGTLEDASAGSEFVNLTVGDTAVPVDPAPNTTMEIPDVATVVVNEVIPDDTGHGFTVRGLRVTLLDGSGDEVIVAEAHSSVVCGDPVFVE